MSDLKIIDAHQHLWDLTNNIYPWLQNKPFKEMVVGDLSPIAKSFLLKDYKDCIKNQNVVKSVHMEALWNPSDPVGESRWVQSVSDSNADGFPHAIVAHALLHEPNVDEVLAGHSQFKNVRGIRHIVNWHKNPAKTFVDRDDLLTDSKWLAGFKLLKKYNYSFDLQLYPSQMTDGARVAHDNPDTQIIIDHTGMPVDRDKDNIDLWRSGMEKLASAENVATKISGLGMVDWNWTVDSIRPFVLQAIEIFGIDRCLFASNFPVDSLYSDYDTLYNAFKEIVKDFTDEEKRKLFHDNAARVYRI